MTVIIPAELEVAVQHSAATRRMPIERLVQEALEWYLRLDPELLDEMTAWQEIRDEAVEFVEGSPS